MDDKLSWLATSSLEKYGVCIYNFDGNTNHTLSLQIGTCLHILERYGHTKSQALWYRGYSLQDKDKKGVFPASHVHIKQCKLDNEGAFESITPLEDPITKEVTFVLREWAVKWKKLYVVNHSLSNKIKEVMLALIDYRRQLAQDTITQDRLNDVKNQIITRIDWGNGKLGLDLVPRLEGEQLDDDKHSVMDLYRVHCTSVENSKGTWPRRMTVSRQRSSKENRLFIIHHLLVNVRGFPCNVGDEAEIYLSLFNGEINEFISEKFLVRFSKHGMPLSMDKIDAYYGIFLDLSDEDVEKDIYLVAQIYRYGKVLLDNNNKKPPVYRYRRPWGGAVLSLKETFKSTGEDEVEYQCKVQSCVDNEINMTQLHESLIKKSQNQQSATRSLLPEKSNFSMAISLRMLHGDLATVKGENPILFTKDVGIAQKLGFSDSVVNPGEVRNDLYLTLRSAEFDRGNKTSAKNVEIDVSVYDEDKNIIPNCINCGCGEESKTTYNSPVFYHNNSPKWMDIIRLSIPIEKFSGSHIRFEYYHCSTRDKNEKKLQGFSFLKVTGKDNSTVYDTVHELCIYKCDESKKMKDYINLPMHQDEFTEGQKGATALLPFNRNSKESLSVSTQLCSTKFTQNTGLLSVLQWSVNRDKISENLRNLITLQPQEIVKYLQDILDALFTMFGANNGEKVLFASDVFHALVHIFNVLQRHMFEKFQYILESYLEENFSYPLIFRDLMSCLQEKVNFAANLSDSRTDVPVEIVLLVLEPLFQFTVKSCNLFKRAYGRDMVNTQTFKEIYSTFGLVLESKDDILTKAKVILLTELHKTYIPLLTVMSTTELSNLIFNLLNRVSGDSSKDIVKAKTRLIKETINCQLFEDTESRSLLLPLFVAHIKKCHIKKISLKLTFNTISDLLDKLFKLKQKHNINGDIDLVVLGIFDIIVESLLNTDEVQRSEDSGVMISSLIELLNIMEDSHYQKLLASYPQGRPLKDFLMRIFLVFCDLSKRDVFPPDWTAMKMITSHSILTAIQYLAQSLTDCFLIKDQFDATIWSSYFDLAVAFITQPSLQLEQFTDAKKNKIKERYQDMRVLLGFQIQMLWNGLGELKQVFIPSLIGPFLKVTLVPEKELRKATIPIFFDMMLCEQKIAGNFTKVENEIIERLDELITSNYGDLEFKQLFKTILLDKVQSEPSIQEDGNKFVFSVTDLLDRLLDYRQVIDGDENSDKRMHCTFNILNFYKDNINREEMYIRYITKLYELHVAANNYVEAGLTLQLYAQQILGWKYDVFTADANFPGEMEWQRKERLYLEIIDRFDEAQAWEYGIPLCKELAVFYETRIFDYKKLSNILQKQATFFNNILEGLEKMRDPSYYRVAYYGQSFPPFVRNKAFIYRGYNCLKRPAIVQQLKTEFPHANILSYSSPPDESIKEEDAQNIQICVVKPIADARTEFSGVDVPIEITNFYSVNEVDTFQFDRPYHKGERDNNNEFKTLCLERTMLKTSYKLPGILRWYEVIDVSVVQISPIETATESIQQVNQELRFLVDRCKIKPANYLQDLTMRLQGIINAAVNGGIPKYQEAFFTIEFSDQHPEELCHLEELRGQLVKQVTLLEEALKLHGRLASTQILPLHKSLLEMFTNMKRGITESGSPRPSRLIHSSLSSSSPRSSTPSTTSLHSNNSNRSSVISGDAVSQEDEHVYNEPAYTTETEPVPPMPDKRRPQSTFYVANPLSQREVKYSPPPIPKRPQSSIFPQGTSVSQLNKLQPRTSSDPTLDANQPQHLSTQGISLSASSSNSEFARSSVDQYNLKRFLSASDSGKDIAPPLPRRKNSEGRQLQKSLSVTTETERPPIPTRYSRRTSSLNTGQQQHTDKTLTPLHEISSSENGSGDTPPLPPRVTSTSSSPQPSIPPSTSSISQPSIPSSTSSISQPSIPPFPNRNTMLPSDNTTNVPPAIPRRVSLISGKQTPPSQPRRVSESESSNNNTRM